MTQYAYDDENNLTSITDANTHVTGFQYDQFGRVKETDLPSGRAESYTYDAIGNLITKLDRNGNAITGEKGEKSTALRLSPCSLLPCSPFSRCTRSSLLSVDS